MHEIGVPEGQDTKRFKRIMVGNVPNIMKIINSQIEDAQWTQIARNMKKQKHKTNTNNNYNNKTTPMHFIINLLKTSDKAI